MEMNKRLLLILIMIGILMVSACSYDSVKAVKNGDVINMNGPVYNFSRFELFLENIKSKKSDSVRIANYNLEGDPTLYNLAFDGSSFDFEIDRSKNKNRGNDATKFNTICTKLITDDGQQVLTYTLEGCDSGSSVEVFTLLTILKEQVDEEAH